MTTTVFGFLYWLTFLIYASRYSSIMQDMNRDIKLLKVKGIKEEVIKERLAVRKSKIGKMKKVVWPFNIFIFLAHL